MSPTKHPFRAYLIPPNPYAWQFFPSIATTSGNSRCFIILKIESDNFLLRLLIEPNWIRPLPCFSTGTRWPQNYKDIQQKGKDRGSF